MSNWKLSQTAWVKVISSVYREMADNMRIDIIPANSFQGITEEYVDMWVQEPNTFF